MSCPDCDGTGWITIERRGVSAAAPCHCRPTASKEHEPVSTEAAAIYTEILFGALGFAPPGELGRDMIADQIRRMCPSIEALQWTVERSISLFSKWPGIPGIRAVLCYRYAPADGIPGGRCPEYPEGISEAIETPRAIDAPTALQLPAGRAFSADTEIEDIARKAVFRRQPAPTLKELEQQLREIIETQNRQRTQSTPPQEPEDDDEPPFDGAKQEKP